ncbi:MAG: hypothetical protein KDK39_13765 [Leptospiraceae bacterium]|nr:hypothetical protein [Leptospiraceae bacterium]
MSRRKKTRARAEALKEHHAANPFEDFDGSPAELYILKTLHWIKINLRSVLIGGALIGSVAIAVIILLAWQESRDEKSMLAFEKLFADHVAREGLSSSRLALDDLALYTKQFTDTNSKIRAALLETDFLTKNKEYKQAATRHQFLAEHIDALYLQAYFWLQAAFLYEESADNEAALKAYQAAGERSQELDTIKAHSLYGQMRMLLALQRKSDADKALSELLKLESERPAIKDLQKQAVALMLLQTAR